jgi:hypothetical protein
MQRRRLQREAVANGNHVDAVTPPPKRTRQHMPDKGLRLNTTCIDDHETSCVGSVCVCVCVCVRLCVVSSFVFLGVRAWGSGFAFLQAEAFIYICFCRGTSSHFPTPRHTQLRSHARSTTATATETNPISRLGSHDFTIPTSDIYRGRRISRKAYKLQENE